MTARCVSARLVGAKASRHLRRPVRAEIAEVYRQRWSALGDHHLLEQFTRTVASARFTRQRRVNCRLVADRVFQDRRTHRRTFGLTEVIRTAESSRSKLPALPGPAGSGWLSDASAAVFAPSWSPPAEAWGPLTGTDGAMFRLHFATPVPDSCEGPAASGQLCCPERK